MCIKRLLSLILIFLLAAPAMAAELEPLPMDTYAYGAAPKDENYISENEYVDESISVKIGQGRYADSDYVYAHVKISHPSQLRTAPAAITQSPKATFRSPGDVQARYIARAVNAVIAINGDFYTKSDKCQVVLRQTKQVRNVANGEMDLLIIDKNGDFSGMKRATKKAYAEYYEANKDNLYQVFCFGPVLVEDGVSVITEDFRNGHVGSGNNTQRSAIAQLGPLEYLLVTSYGNQTKGNKGLTILEFAGLCEELGKSLSENGCKLAFNLDGGNSATMVFKRVDEKKNQLLYAKVNCPEIERNLSDIIYFATLVK